MAQYKGSIAWFNNAKGYGFIKADGMPDVFCHFSSIVSEGYKSLNEGEAVEFDTEQGSQGLQAAKVKRLS